MEHRFYYLVALLMQARPPMWIVLRRESVAFMNWCATAEERNNPLRLFSASLVPDHRWLRC
ncbi:hypothetical protein [Pelodictyon phaeoclathratiforme]|uniref:hypothetical protein n=1 Tax=Pelodictyon phaeoclathratiforme TaxID=34090 RepID=UPI00167F9F91|nr:hypothetical protein [Pelodictyon phaeoclathratiforme]MBV5290425.1 hypothetical protein [Pelodictyon phaeoclathratiforme]